MPGTIVGKHLVHGAADDDDAIGRQTLAEQMGAGDLAIGQVDVADVIDDLAIDLLRYALVKATIAGLHVKHGNLAPLGRDGR